MYKKSTGKKKLSAIKLQGIVVLVAVSVFGKLLPWVIRYALESPLNM